MFDAWLLVLAEHDSATAELLRGTGADVVDPDDEAAMVRVLRARFDEFRAGKRATLMIQVGERPPEDQLAQIGSGATPNGAPDSSAAAPQRALGLSLTALTPELARAANLPAGTRGVIITAVDPNSDASDKGLQRGDLILSVNNQLVTTPAQVVAAVDAARKAGRASVLLLAKRGNTPEQFIGVDIGNR